jgi:hypothetical protein
MKCNGPNVALIEVLVHLKRIAFAVERGTECLVEGRQVVARDVDHRPVDGGNIPNRILRSRRWCSRHLYLGCLEETLLAGV